MNLLFPIKDFNLGINNSTFFEIANLSPGNYDDDIDQIIHSFIRDKEKSSIESFTIPISLSNNFMEFSGLLLAHHIRLSRELKFCDVPIVFYGSLKLEQLLRITPLARILLTSNVVYVDTTKYSFADIQKSLKDYKPKSFDTSAFLDQIQINPPANYDFHHSVDNEFALIQWSKFIKCYDELPPIFRKEYESKLYFKYLKSKQTLAQVEKPLEKTIIKRTGNVSILLIDDEAVKGWEAFYSSLFSNSSKEIKFEDSGIDFKDPNISDLIISRVENKVIQFKPDIVLLDLRLHDSDFHKETPPAELTGLKILEKIKEINRGIQVIITTASNKAWNFNLAKQKGAYDFIIKDGFEDPLISIVKLTKAIEIASKRAFFLKEIGKKNAEIKDFIFHNNYFDDNSDDNKVSQERTERIRNKLYSNLDLAFELLDLSCEISGKEKYFAYSYLQYFICIEEFLKIKEIFEFGDNCYVSKSTLVAQKDPVNSQWTSSIKHVDSKPSYYHLKEDSNNQRLNPQQTDFKMSSVLIYLFNQDNSNSKNWPIIRDVRNQKAAHPEKGKVTKGNIIQLLDFLLFIFNKGCIQEVNDKKGLSDNIRENDLVSLVNKFKSK